MLFDFVSAQIACRASLMLKEMQIERNASWHVYLHISVVGARF